MSDVLRGSCSCKAVAVECTRPFRYLTNCHCENCRKAHGVGVVTWVCFDEHAVRFVGDDALLGRYVTETGGTRTFCRRCGTRLSFAAPRWPGEIDVAAGIFDDPLDALPKGHVYADRAPRWCPITDDLPRRGGPTGVELQ